MAITKPSKTSLPALIKKENKMKDELEKRIKDLREKISHIRNENKSFEMLKKLNRLISLYEDMYFDIL